LWERACSRRGRNSSPFLSPNELWAVQTSLLISTAINRDDAKDISNAVVFLASYASDCIVGTTLFIDGGMSLYPEFRGNG
jgi:hypothetical protein